MMSAPRTNSTGMFPWEQEIMDLWDSGLSKAAIAIQTGKPIDHVSAVVGRYAITEPVLNSFDRMVASGSAALLAAIRCFHPEIFTRGHP